MKLIWWTNEQDCKLLAAVFWDQSDEDASEASGPPSWPDYIAQQYSSRYGRNGRGRLWVAKHFGDVSVKWPETRLGDRLAGDGERRYRPGEKSWDRVRRDVAPSGSYAGIVIDAKDYSHVVDLPGVVTDMALRFYIR